MSALTPPGKIWWTPLGKDEKIWLIVGLVWSLFMFSVMWWWPVVGEQTTPIESYRIDPTAFFERVDRFIERYQIDSINGVPVVEPPVGGEAYIHARAFEFRPVLKLKRGATYRIYLSSTDVQHGFSLQPLNMNFQALPGYVYVLTLTPRDTGEFPIVCNEYCGLGHHLMTGKLIVTD